MVNLNDRLIVLIVNIGDKYSPIYTQKITSMLKRQPFKNIELSLITESQLHEIPHDAERLAGRLISLKHTLYNYGWWIKLCLFFHEPPWLYIDLDTVLVDDISGLINDAKPGLTVVKDFYGFYGMTLGSAFMYFNPEPDDMLRWTSLRGDILNEELETLDIRYPGGDQQYLEEKLGKDNVNYWPSDAVVSYKKDCQKGLPDGAKVVCFHGQPKQIDVDDLWVLKHW